MSVLGIKEVVKLITDIGLVDGLGGRELSNPEGTGIDFRLGSVHEITAGGAFIEADGQNGLGKRKGVQTTEVAKYVATETPPVVSIEPGQYYLVQTVESVNLPKNMMAIVYPRSSLFRSGLMLVTGKGDPGYKGQFTFGLINQSKYSVEIQLGARFCNVVFLMIEGETVGYRGQHQGGRISFGEETQV